MPWKKERKKSWNCIEIEENKKNSFGIYCKKQNIDKLQTKMGIVVKFDVKLDIFIGLLLLRSWKR